MAKLPNVKPPTGAAKMGLSFFSVAEVGRIVGAAGTSCAPASGGSALALTDSPEALRDGVLALANSPVAGGTAAVDAV